MKKPATHQDLNVLPKALEPLADEKHWVCWNWEQRANKDGVMKWTKPPVRPSNPKAYAEFNNAATWDTYQRALQRARDGDADGIGFMLLGAGIGAVDLDHCCTHDLQSDELRVDPWAAEIEAVGYVEVTVSGSGLRIIGRAEGGTLQRPFDLENGARVELFRNTARYITVSGLEFSQCCELPPIDEFLDELLKRYDTGKKKKSDGAQDNRPKGNGRAYSGRPMNATTRALIEALNGNLDTGACCCIAHDDAKPSLRVSDGDQRDTVFVCYAGCTQSDIIAALRARGLWPLPSPQNGSSRKPTVRSPAQRRAHALEILRDTEALGGRERARLMLREYFARRGIERVPPTALLALSSDPPPESGERFVPDEPAMIFEVVDGIKAIGCHITDLSPDLATKKDVPQPRETRGPISGGYIKLFEGELYPTSKLIIGEGVENALSAAQLAGGLPAIAAISAKNLPKIKPPPASEYIIAGDNDGPGGPGVPAARALAVKLVRAGHRVRLMIPPRPGSDWNDVLMERISK